MASNKVSNLSSILAKILSITNDIKKITLSTAEGVELISEARSKTIQDESEVISSFVISFVTSSDQSLRLELGPTEHSIVWLANGCTLIQKTIQGLVLSILMDESANIGLIEEQLPSIENILKPFCSFVPS